MDLTFATEQLRAICESRRRAVNWLGIEASQALETILADIEACQSLSEFESIHGNLAIAAATESWELKLNTAIALRFKSGHVKTPRRKNGRIDRSKVTRIRIEEIEAAV